MIYIIRTVLDNRNIAVACTEETARVLLPIWSKANPNETECRDVRTGTCWTALESPDNVGKESTHG